MPGDLGSNVFRQTPDSSTSTAVVFQPMLGPGQNEAGPLDAGIVSRTPWLAAF
jgi:hypothetical protein